MNAQRNVAGTDDDEAGTRKRIDAMSLTTYDVDPAGRFAQLHLRDEAGLPATVKLPTNCLTQLLMTLPKMVQMALRNGQGDSSLRLVHSLDHFCLELSESSATCRPQLILTLQTGDGFGVSFTANEGVLSDLANTILNPSIDIRSDPHARH